MSGAERGETGRATKVPILVDKLEFEQQGPTLSYWPTQGARTYQAVGATGIALVFGFFAYLIFKNKPLSNLGEDLERWNSAAALAPFDLRVGVTLHSPGLLARFLSRQMPTAGWRMFSFLELIQFVTRATCWKLGARARLLFDTR